VRSGAIQCNICHDWQLEYVEEEVMSYLVDVWPNDEAVRMAYLIIEEPIKEHVRTEHPWDWGLITMDKRLT
jgi:hypothetical protein